MDPEQIYQEVLSEEQAKGSPSAVAEARAKAARQRAVHGSPHPKEPRWWPGSQPQFEGGGDGAAPAAEAEPEEEAAPEPEPVAEEPAAAPPDVGDEAQSERPDAPAPAPAASTEAAQQAAPEPAAAPAAAAVAAPAAAAAPARPAGVTHGTDSGNRLRPEDSVGTDAQFDAQKAMADRRRLIDELIATGVPAATAEQAGQPKAPLLLLAYILIPLLAIFLVSQATDDEAEAGGEAPVASAAPEGPTTAVAAEGNAFDTETITLAAGEPASIDFENHDPVQHNIAIYEDESAAAEIFKGDIIEGGDSTTYEFDAPPKGEYFFRCDVHPDMNGTAVSE
ncbi:MAG TPA: cupredoxin domain-containing protein [Actinomycetota bacterium]|nr:cupredoxin domain-containing protein [Actinomycetota bacterium]